MSDIGLLGQFGGMNIIVDDVLMAEFVEDWSRVRSPSRAERRRKRGFPQNIKWVKSLKPDVYQFGNRLVMSSKTLAALKARTESPNVT